MDSTQSYVYKELNSKLFFPNITLKLSTLLPLVVDCSVIGTCVHILTCNFSIKKWRPMKTSNHNP